MGMRASLTLISSRDYAALLKNPKADISLDGEHYDIDKAWVEFHKVFKRLGGPLKFAIEGKYCPYGNFEENDDGMADGFVSATVAARIAQELAKLPLKSIIDSVKGDYRNMGLDFPEGEGPYLRAHFATLKKAYTAAAKKKMAVHIGIG